MDHVVDAEPFCADGSGEKNPVKEPQNPTEKAGAGEEQGAGKEGFFARCQPGSLKRRGGRNHRNS